MAPGFHLEEELGAYQLPLYVTASHAPNRLFVVEQTGRIKVAESDGSGGWIKAGKFLDLRDRVNDPRDEGGEQGLLGMAFHPDYETNRKFYVNYTRRSGDPAKNGDTIIAEYERETAFTADPASRRVVLRIDQPYDNHNGGWMAFGRDGYLYIASGDGGGSEDPDDNAQDLGTLLGKFLRIDPLDPDEAGPDAYTVPADNPFVGVVARLDEIWSYGVRNPWRNSFDSETGDLWIGDVGERDWEEIDHSTADASSLNAGRGLNYGWDLCEGAHVFEGTAADCGFDETDPAPPVIEYDHSDGRCSVTGGYVYRGTGQPSLVGRYFLADFCSGQIWSVPTTFEMGDALPTPIDSGELITSFGEDAVGELYVVSRGGSILRVVED